MHSTPTLSRRRLVAAALAGTAGLAGGTGASAAAQAQRPSGAFGLDAASLGLRPGSPDDQSRVLQSAVEEAARRDLPLMLAPGRYRVSGIALPEGTRLQGVAGATRLAAARPGPILRLKGVRRASLAGLVLDGLGLRMPERTGLLAAEDVEALGLGEMEFTGAGAVGLTLLRSGGRIAGNRFAGMADAALFSLHGTGLAIEGNIVEDCGNNGIQLWRSSPGDDRSVVRGNRIERIRSDAGGDGPNGNGISLYKAGGVIVEGNTLRDCALSFIRNNSGSGVQILGNQGRRCGEVALYSEFAFEGVVIANNLVEETAQGVNITNLDHGGRLAVCANNLIRGARRGFAPKGRELVGGIGIHVEAEAAVTGNVVEGASEIGISLGWSWGMRNLAATGNVVRDTRIGISVSLVPKERNVVIANNVIAGATAGAILGTEYGRPVTGDLARAADPRAAGVRVDGNSAG